MPKLLARQRSAPMAPGVFPSRAAARVRVTETFIGGPATWGRLARARTSGRVELRRPLSNCLAYGCGT